MRPPASYVSLGAAVLCDPRAVRACRYTSPWWDWERWETQLDSFALAGANLPLAVLGFDAVAADVFQELGVSEAGLECWLSPNAFMPWQLMGNQAGWGGPMPPAYRASLRALNARILQRMYDFGMLAVLPCFGGNVPGEWAKLHPSKQWLRPYPSWHNFDEESSLLDPLAPDFAAINARFVARQLEVYGPDLVSGYFSCDVFMNDR